MFLTRRINSLCETGGRLPHKFAKLGAIATSALLLAACEPASEPDTSEVETPTPSASEDNIELVSTGVVERVESEGVEAVAFLPDSSTAWAGLIVSAPREGGLDLYNADGQSVHRMAGPRLWGLASAPGFQLRGEALPLLFAADRDANLVRAFALFRDGPALIEAPLEPISMDSEIASLCALGEGIGYVDLLVLSRSTTAEIWRISDTGGELIGAERIRSFDLPFPARSCAAGNGFLYASGPAGGIIRFDESGAVDREIEGFATSLTAGPFLGRPVLLATDGTATTIEALDGMTLERIGDVVVRAGFSIPGISQPGAISSSEASFGGAAYQSGLVAIADEEDGRIRLIARETFARALTLTD
ncbi:hypothetical protein [Hyphobacterium sp.]|uniref:hypothetical protein n=1 Tax=Hyphobacterium sp. TaxID=2004662 RepID=UPI003BAA144A